MVQDLATFFLHFESILTVHYIDGDFIYILKETLTVHFIDINSFTCIKDDKLLLKGGIMEVIINKITDELIKTFFRKNSRQ